MNRFLPTLITCASMGLAATLVSSCAENPTPAQPTDGPALGQTQDGPPAGQAQYESTPSQADYASTSGQGQYSTPDAQRAVAAQIIQACGQDLQRFCANVQPGEGRKVQCLVARRNELSTSCRSLLASLASHRG
jgi:hypothetical protein